MGFFLLAYFIPLELTKPYLRRYNIVMPYNYVSCVGIDGRLSCSCTVQHLGA